MSDRAVRVLAMIGSPRKGNTYEIVRRIEDKMMSLGPIEFEYIFLKDAYLGSCCGCQLCFLHGEGACPLGDDRAVMAQKMQEVDGLILASPVYALQVPAVMKNLLDRFAYLFHRPRLFGKKALAVADELSSVCTCSRAC